MTPRIKVLVAVASALGVIALIDFAWRSSSAEMASQSPMGASFSAYNAITKDEPSHAAAKLAPVDAKSPGFLQPLFSPARVANHPDQIESVIFDEPAQSPTDPFEAS